MLKTLRMSEDTEKQNKRKEKRKRYATPGSLWAVNGQVLEKML